MAAAAEYAGEETDIGLRLWLVLKPRLAAEAVTTVYETLERPLAAVLAQMERTGVMVDGWKYIELPTPELYDLEHDPGETRNLARREPERSRMLEARLKTIVAGGRGAAAQPASA